MIRLATYGLLILGCLTACKKEADASVANGDNAKQQNTVNNTLAPGYIGQLSTQSDTLITLNGLRYNIDCHAVIDRLKKVSYTVVGRDTKDGKVHKSVFNGYDATYTISVKEANGNKLFTKTFTKNDFKGVIGEDALAQAIIDPAGFLGYHKGFDAFMFGMSFMIPDSDVGDGCFIMITRDGRIIEKSHNAFYGGGGPDGMIEIPTNNAFVITPTKILNTNGKKVDLSAGNTRLVHTKLINDHTILVVYDPDEGDTKDNACLMDNNAKILKKMREKWGVGKISQFVDVQ